MQHKQSRKEGKRQGTRHEGRASESSPDHLHQGQAKAGSQRTHILHHISKICLDFAVCCLRFSRGNTKAHQKIIYFCHFCPDDRQGIGWRVLDVCPDMGRVEHKRGTPPPIAGATSALHPHNFSHHKNRKKSAPKDWLM